MRIILTEKPSVAADFAKALHAERHEGYYQNNDTIITYCVGHLYELAGPDYYTGQKKWSFDDLPVIPEKYIYKRKTATAKQAAVVHGILQKYRNKEIIIATDADREGELIARTALTEAGITSSDSIFRFWVSEALTESVIKSGLENVKKWTDYDMLFRQGEARQQADWLVGMNLTEFVSLSTKQLMTVGRVQTAVLAAVAARNEEIRRFKSTPYETLDVLIEDVDGNSIKSSLINPQTDKTAFAFGSSYLKQAAAYLSGKKVEKAEAKIVTKIRHTPPLFDITALQQAAAKAYDYSPEKTLTIAQKLYEKYKCLSYPRTPSRVMGDDNVQLFLDKFRLLIPHYPQYAALCNPGNITQKNTHIFNSKKLEAHHALIPLDMLPETASEEEKNVYALVAGTFLTVCMDDNIVEEKQIVFHCGPYTCRAAVAVTKQEGWKASIQGEKKDETPAVKKFNEHDCRVTHTVLNKKMTTPPEPYSTDTLLAFMKNPKSEKTDQRLAGLGTSATRAAIIQKLFDREYLLKKKKELYVTETGNFLLGELKKDCQLMRLTDTAQTTEWEKMLDENPAEFINKMKEYVKLACSGKRPDVYERPSEGICPVCRKGKILKGKKNWYCSEYKNGCRFVIWPTICESAITEDDVHQLLSGKYTRLKKMKSKAGKEFKAKLMLKDGKVEFAPFEKVSTHGKRT